MRDFSEYAGQTVDEQVAGYLIFMKHICGFEPYATQILQAEQYFRHKYAIEVKPPRTGKSCGKNGVNLYECCVNDYEEVKIYTPKFSIGKEALGYVADWVEKSGPLRSFLKIENGKRQKSKTKIEFQNGSGMEVMSVAGKIEGHNVTIADIMEFDLWDWSTFRDDVTRRFGAKNRNGKPTRVRIDGTILGQENIYKVVTDKVLSELYHNMMYTDEQNFLGIQPGLLMDVDMMLAMDILDPEIVEFQKKQMSPDEVKRSLYLLFTESTNFIWSRYLLAVMRKAAKWGLEGVQPVKGGKYEAEGVVAVGFDCGHGGSDEEHSSYSLQFYEQVGMYRRWLYGKRWIGTYDPNALEREILELLEFYLPEGGYADALKMNVIASICDKAFSDGITWKDRGDHPENKPSDWEKWYISPLWNSDKNKHLYYDSLQKGIHQFTCFYPFYSPMDTTPVAKAMSHLKRTLLNIRKERTKGAYPRYYAFDKIIGDDDTDAAGMANLWLDTHVGTPLDLTRVGIKRIGSPLDGLHTDRIDGQLNIYDSNDF